MSLKNKDRLGNNAQNRAPAQKVIVSSLANRRVGNALIAALGDHSTCAVIATSVSQTLDFENFYAGDIVVRFPAGAPIDLSLGAASNFAILANSTITNTGNSVLSRDLGLYPGTSVTGFPPGIVNGAQHITDAVAQQAQIDALAAYTLMAANGGYSTIASALDAQTLNAGYYEFASGAATLAASAPGTLTFNGSASDIFVIKTASTLGVGAGGAGTIAFTGGAKAENVYWIVGSSATINDAGTSMAGNILANTSVTFSAASAMDGRVIALGGAVILNGNVISGFSPGVSSTEFFVLTIDGNLGRAAIVGDLYMALSKVDLDSDLVPSTLV